MNRAVSTRRSASARVRVEPGRRTGRSRPGPAAACARRARAEVRGSGSSSPSSRPLAPGSAYGRAGTGSDIRRASDRRTSPVVTDVSRWRWLSERIARGSTARSMPACARRTRVGGSRRRRGRAAAATRQAGRHARTMGGRGLRRVRHPVRGGGRHGPPRRRRAGGPDRVPGRPAHRRSTRPAAPFRDGHWAEDLAAWLDRDLADADVRHWPAGDIAAGPSSGSYRVRGMAVVPASTAACAGIAIGSPRTCCSAPPRSTSRSAGRWWWCPGRRR